MLPRKKQKLEQDATSSGRRGQLASGSLGNLSRFYDATLKDGTPEPSGTGRKRQEGAGDTPCRCCMSAV